MRSQSKSCFNQEIVIDNHQVLFIPYLCKSRGWWKLFSYVDQKPFSVLEESFEKLKLSSMLDINEAISDLQPLVDHNDRHKICKISSICDLVLLLIISIIIVTIVICKLVVTEQSNVLFFLTSSLNLVLIILLFFLNFLIKSYYAKRFWVSMESFLIQLNCDKYIDKEKEWFTDKRDNGSFTGYIGIRFYNSIDLERKYGPF